VEKKKLFVETVGCQMNVLDTELVVGGLRQDGYEVTTDPTAADTILFNTCSVREHAEEKIYSALGRLKHAKKERPDLVIGVIGCMAQKDKHLVFERAPHVDLICSPGQLARIPDLVKEARSDRKRITALGLNRNEGARKDILQTFESYDPLRDPSLRPTPFQAFVRLQMGCDKFCTYCIVPTVRGPEQGRDPTDVVAEVRKLVEEGCVEITFLGQTVNSYKHVAGDGRTTRLSDLLSAVHDLPSLRRVKFITNYPRDMSDDLLDAIRSLPKVSPYIHVPAQSGCDDVLKAMKRGYTVGQYWEMLHRLRERAPNSTVSSDFIVGFPGESRKSFELTCNMVRDAKFKNSFIFKYSPREGTKSFVMIDDITEDEKKRRNNELLAIQQENSFEDSRAQIGSLVEILVEGPSKTAIRKDQTGSVMQLTGRTHEDRIVVFEGHERLVGRFAAVKIVDCTPFTLFGEVATQELVSLG
jgi:tRNA-2-methylthio-N6-dimethylallyladenosine synthase